MNKVIIGIQARSTSERLPGKSMMKISGQYMLERTIKSCHRSCDYITNKEGSNIICDTVVLTPTGDPIKRQYGNRANIFEGPEEDVLSRYHLMSQQYKADYYVRITGDCPLIPSFVISKHIVAACNYKYDYVSNVDEACRTHPDGWDVEVISSKLLEWCHENATDPMDREHVTTYIRSNTPSWARTAGFVGYVDFSTLKISVDTQDDLTFVRAYDEVLEKKMKLAKNKYDRVFRL